MVLVQGLWVGALFKILHLAGANGNVDVGFVNEAFIFFWVPSNHRTLKQIGPKVYPELSEDYEAPTVTTATRINNTPKGDSPLLKIWWNVEDRKSWSKTCSIIWASLTNLATSASQNEQSV